MLPTISYIIIISLYFLDSYCQSKKSFATMVPVQHLPKADSPDLHLVLATPAEILQQLHHNSEEWRGALTLDAYLRREEVLGSQELTKNGGLTSWMLVQGEGEGRRVLCGCESIRKKALVAGPGARDGVEEVACHGVASVFCPHEYRGRGYAGRMMQELGPRLKEWDARGKRVLMSVLFSDIGKVGRCNPRDHRKVSAIR